MKASTSGQTWGKTHSYGAPFLALVMKPLEMMNTKPVRVPTLQTPAAMLRRPRGLVVKWKGQPPRAAKVPQNRMVRCQSMQPHHQKTGKDTATKGAKTSAPSSSQPPPDPDSKVTEAEQKCQQCKDAQHLDKHFGIWHHRMLTEGHAGWKEHDEMHCEHGEPFRELQNQDPAGLPLDYVKQRGVFKAKKTNKYDLCHFYHVELSGGLPPFPSPREPATRKMLEEFLRAAQALGYPNLLMAFARNSATPVCLLQELHHKDSLKCLPLEPKSDADIKMVKKLSFCLFCLYNGSNDISYMNHIMGRHYVLLMAVENV